jgi:hypothetical protein
MAKVKQHKRTRKNGVSIVKSYNKKNKTKSPVKSLGNTSLHLRYTAIDANKERVSHHTSKAAAMAQTPHGGYVFDRKLRKEHSLDPSKFADTGRKDRKKPIVIKKAGSAKKAPSKNSPSKPSPTVASTPVKKSKINKSRKAGREKVRNFFRSKS